MKLSDIVSGGLGGLVKEIGGIVDQFHVSKEEKTQLQIALEDAANRQFEIIERSVQARYAAVAKVIESEMAQGDNYTKRARPTVVYAGLFFFFLESIGPLLGAELKISPDFTYAWAGVVGVWMVGRSYEKVKGPGEKSRWVTGNQPVGPPEL